MTDAFNYVWGTSRWKGLENATSYPYTSNTYWWGIESSCKAKNTKKSGQISSYTKISTSLSSIRTALLKGPLSNAVYADDLWMSYAGGDLLALKKSTIGSTTVNHAVVLIGFNSTHFFIRNSWGTSWGDNGDGYIPASITDSRYFNSNFNTYVYSVSAA